MNAFLDMLTNFIFVEDSPEAADIIFIPGGEYGALAKTAARLWHQGFAPLILPSGKHSILHSRFNGSKDGLASVSCPNPETEHDFFKGLLIDEGVPASCILEEKQATYTYQNAIYSKAVTDALGLNIKKAIITCQAFHARRCLLYYQLLFPDTQFLIYPTTTQNISKNNWYLDSHKADIVLGEIERCGSQFHDIIKAFSLNTSQE